MTSLQGKPSFRWAMAYRTPEWVRVKTIKPPISKQESFAGFGMLSVPYPNVMGPTDHFSRLASPLHRLQCRTSRLTASIESSRSSSVSSEGQKDTIFRHKTDSFQASLQWKKMDYQLKTCFLQNWGFHHKIDMRKPPILELIVFNLVFNCHHVPFLPSFTCVYIHL